MKVLMTVLLAVQILAAMGMIGLILVQHGKGADAGAAFGSGGGGSGSLFGASGSANFLSRTTAVLAAVFFACTLALAYFGNAQPRAGSSVLESPAAVMPPAPGAGQIPGATAPAAGAGNAEVPPAPVAPGAGQIPTK